MTHSTFRDGLLRGKTAFVTGGSSGINLGIATALVKAGARVAINGRNEEKLAAAVAGLRAHGEAIGFAADVREYDAIDRAVRDAVAALGPIDVLVCGAAGNFPAPAVGMSSRGFRAVVDIDLVGSFNAARAAFDHLRKPGAAVVAVSAPQATQPMPMQSHVCAAKAGVEMLVRCLALEWGGAGVRVNAISPGPIAGTEGMERLAPGEDARERIAGAMPLQRLGSVDDVADAALFLCSDAARFVTGAVLPCDGGQSLLG
ncbi:MAG TPA: SDR family oxidoreductase, partial [Anaeromyxobacteraceae bacterium]|nr:SDR family oxidoreductase [Anaeromyxobacteraceae bacterium]